MREQAERMASHQTLLARAWTLAAGVTGAIGLFAALRSFGVLGVLGLFVSSAVLGVMLVVPWMPEVTWRSRSLVVAGPVTGFVVVVATGLAVVLGLSAVLWVLLLVAVSPQVLRVLAILARRLGWMRPARPSADSPAPDPRPGGPRPNGGVVPQQRKPSSHRPSSHRPSSHRPPPPHPVPPAPPAEMLPMPEDFVVPDLMDDADLCRAWRSSYVALERARSVESRLRVVAIRAIYLDELERRAGAGFQAWIGSGARAAGDPSRYVDRHRRHLAD